MVTEEDQNSFIPYIEQIQGNRQKPVKTIALRLQSKKILENNISSRDQTKIKGSKHKNTTL
jgi:hypothetical protein